MWHRSPPPPPPLFPPLSHTQTHTITPNHQCSHLSYRPTGPARSKQCLRASTPKGGSPAVCAPDTPLRLPPPTNCCSPALCETPVIECSGRKGKMQRKFTFRWTCPALNKSRHTRRCPRSRVGWANTMFKTHVATATPMPTHMHTSLMAKCAWANICPSAKTGLARSSCSAFGRSSQVIKASRAANAASRPTCKIDESFRRAESV